MDYLKLDYLYKTTSNQAYPLELGIKLLSSDKVIHNYQEITDLCRRGCKNFNVVGGCPPNAPSPFT